MTSNINFNSNTCLTNNSPLYSIEREFLDVTKSESISLNHTKLRNVKSYHNAVTVRECECEHIEASAMISLYNSFSATVNSHHQGIKWENSQLNEIKASSIQASGEIALIFVNVDTVQSLHHGADLKNCVCNIVETSAKIVAQNSYASTLTSQHSSISVENAKTTEHMFRKIQASSTVTLKFVYAQDVCSYHDGVKATHSNITTLSANKEVSLTDTKVEKLILNISSEDIGEIVLDNLSLVNEIVIAKKTPAVNVYMPRSGLAFGDPSKGWKEGDHFYVNGFSSGQFFEGAIGAYNGVRCKYIKGQYVPLDQITKTSNILQVRIKGAKYNGTIRFVDDKGSECTGEVIEG